MEFGVFDHLDRTGRDLTAYYENRLKIDYEIYDIATGDSVTKAQTVQVAVTPAGELVFQSPDALIEKVRKLLTGDEVALPGAAEAQ